jgi:hypothetical protein|tara:strand:+ start:439 stop:573 length:135 start_codon:yes stop_codon:yes gene_type:complete
MSVEYIVLAVSLAAALTTLSKVEINRRRREKVKMIRQMYIDKCK